MNTTPQVFFGTRDRDAAATNACLAVIDLTYTCAHPDYGWVRLHTARGAHEIAQYYTDRLSAEVLPNAVRLLDEFRQQQRAVAFAVFGGQKEDLSDLTVRARRQNEEWTARGLPSPYAPVADERDEVLSQLHPRSNEKVVRKVSFSAFRDTDLHAWLQAREIDSLVFIGVGTNYCVMLSLLEAYELGYRCLLVSDATATLTGGEQETAEAFVAPYADVMTTPDALRWLRDRSLSRTAGAEL